MISCAQSREAIQDHWLADCSTVSIVGVSWDCETIYQAVFQVAKRECGYFCTASIAKSGLSHNPREVIHPIKDITAILCHLGPVPE